MEYAAIKSYVSKLLFQIQTEINISNSDECIGIDRALHMMRFIRPLCDELRKHTVNYQFRDEAEEIYFFKELKPEVLSKYMYYNKIYVIESKFPTGSDVAQKEYLYNELNSLTFYFSRNLDFYQYYRSHSTMYDKYYFVRGKADIRLCADSAQFDKDPNFSTGYDYTVAKILANEMLRIYLNQRLQLLEKKQLTNDIKISLSDFKLKWTGTKSEAIEWGYGLFAAKTLNYGNATIKEVMAFVETAFDIELGDYYRTYLSLKNRKKDRTAFFTFIMEQLQKRMDDDL